MSFAGKVVLITGANSGIGADAAVHLAKLGASISMIGRDTARLTDVAEQIRSACCPDPLTITADVTTDAERIIAETVEHFGKLDVLVNNAGIFQIASIEETSLDAFDLLWGVNIRGPFELAKLAIPHLVAAKGNIVNVSSVLSYRPSPDCAVYCISKAALDQFTKCLALDLAPKGVRVNSINPGIVNTPAFEKQGFNGEVLDNYFTDVATRYPIRRIGQVSDTSAAVAFLASDDASFVTGALVPVDGGIGLVCPR